jgi:undecaprenyl-diphosphatase
VVALAANVAATSWWYRARPYAALHDVHALIAPNPESSFFSDHTVVATGCALGALLVSRRWGIVAIAIALAVGLARVAVGAHYPTDVLAAVAVTTLATVVLLPTRPKLTIGIGKLFTHLPASIAGRSTAIRPSRARAG